jgi:hypothetical protein
MLNFFATFFTLFRKIDSKQTSLYSQKIYVKKGDAVFIFMYVSYLRILYRPISHLGSIFVVQFITVLKSNRCVP